MLKLIKEENVKPVALDQVDDVQISEPEQQEVPEIIINNACQDIVNNLIQSAWNFISEINSTIATIEYDFKDAKAKKEIIELLNSIVDDSTVNIGILHKVFELLNSEKAELLVSGQEKAEEIINNTDTEE